MPLGHIGDILGHVRKAVLAVMLGLPVSVGAAGVNLAMLPVKIPAGLLYKAIEKVEKISNETSKAAQRVIEK